jgi:hypothetical protein
MQYAKQETVRTTNVFLSKWSNRFIWASIIQGLAATLLTVPAVLPSVTPSVAHVIAGGGAGMWFVFGYLSYITVGVIGVAVTALFYQHFEVTLGKPYHGITNYLGWIHLVFMNVGVAAATLLMMYGGYFAAAALIPAAQGGGGHDATFVHVNILAPLVNPIGYAVIIAGVGVLAGGAGFVLNYLRK